MSRFPENPTRRPAVVTGASSGIGEAVARALAAQGHPVVLGARRVEEMESPAAEIRSSGGEAHVVALDLGDPSSPAAFAREAERLLGEVEIVVSNAAMNQSGSMLTTDPEDFARTLEVNVQGNHRLLQALLPAMIERRRGDVVVVTSDVVARPRPSMIAYVSSKWGLEGYVRTLQMELEGSGVRATVLRPGPTLTGMGMDWDPDETMAVLEEWQSWGLARHSNFMTPEGVAQGVLAVVSLPRGTHVTTIELHPEAPIAKGFA